MGSYPYAVTPTFEQQWREEVLYLHSLWHKGPPRNPRPKPKLNSNYLGASNSTTPKLNSNNLGAPSSMTPKLNSIDVGASSSTAPKLNSINLGASSSTTPKLDSINLGASSSTTRKLNSINLGASSSTTPKLDSINLGASSSTTPKLNSINLGASSSTAPKLNSINLGASNPTTFKKRKNKQRLAKKRKDPEPICLEVEMPCGPNPEPCQETVWPESNPQSDQATRPATTEEQAKSTALYLQQKGLKACENFFSSNISSNGDGEEEDDLMDDDVNESEEFKFFLGIFTDDSDLKNYYEKNWERGEFCCLVCAVTGKKKRFKNCVALVQHSTAISKTKRKAAHRAFGKAICQVLGWDIHRLPVIVLSPDGPLGHSISKAESEVGLKQYSAQKEELHKNFIDLVDDTKGEVDSKDHGVSIKKEDLQGKVVDFVSVDKDESMDFQVAKKDDGLDGEVDPKDHGASSQKEDLQGKVVDFVNVDKDERMEVQVAKKDDGLDGEVDPKDHGASSQKEDLQGKVVDFVNVDKDERMEFQVGAKKDNGFHQKDCDSETVEEMGGHIMGMRWIVG